MRTIVVDDELHMIKSFERLSKDIPRLEVIKTFRKPLEALEFAGQEQIDLAVLDITMPRMDGLELASALRKLQPEIRIVFISAYDSFLPQSNDLGADDFIIKPYKRETLVRMAEKIELLSEASGTKRIKIETFGRFSVIKEGNRIRLSGKPKEILAYLVASPGRLVSNDEIYSALWENREKTNDKMKVYFNALRRLKDILKENDMEDLMESTSRGHSINTEIVDCDYYNYLEGRQKKSERFEGEFLSEYSWAEVILGKLVFENQF